MIADGESVAHCGGLRLHHSRASGCRLGKQRRTSLPRHPERSGGLLCEGENFAGAAGDRRDGGGAPASEGENCDGGAGSGVDGGGAPASIANLSEQPQHRAKGGYPSQHPPPGTHVYPGWYGQGLCAQHSGRSVG